MNEVGIENVPAIAFRLATLADGAALEALIPLSVHALQADHYTLAQREGALGAVFGLDRQLIRDGTYFVAEVDGRVVGGGGWSQRKTSYGGDHKRSGEDLLRDPKSEPAIVRAFFVHPEYARRGIGRRLLELSEAAALAGGFWKIEIVATLPGERLYSKFNYTVVEHFSIPLENGESLPVVRLVKTLHRPTESFGSAR